MPDDELTSAQNGKITNREILRLQESLKQAKNAEKKLCFFHYPPRTKNSISNGLISVMNDYGVLNCYYGHLHGEGHYNAVQGLVDGIKYELISADYINFIPQKII